MKFVINVTFHLTRKDIVDQVKKIIEIDNVNIPEGMRISLSKKVYSKNLEVKIEHVGNLLTLKNTIDDILFSISIFQNVASIFYE